MNTGKFDGFRALNELELFSGRYHQLRVHMLALDLLLEGHLFYLEVLRGPGALENLTQPLQSLAHRIAFFDPGTGAERVFDSQRSIRFGRGQVVPVQDTGALVRKQVRIPRRDPNFQSEPSGSGIS